MLLEAESQQMAKHLPMTIGHHLSGFSNKVIIGPRHQRIDIVRQCILRRQITGSSKTEQTQTMVKQRCRGNDFILSVIDLETKVPEMAIFIADHGIKHDHVVQRINVSATQGFVIFPDRRESTLPY